MQPIIIIHDQGQPVSLEQVEVEKTLLSILTVNCLSEIISQKSKYCQQKFRLYI